MNQILELNDNKKSRPQKINTSGVNTEVKGIIKFFSIAIMIFGIVLVGRTSYAIYDEMENQSPKNSPTVIIGRINDKAIIDVKSNTEISKIIYYWNEGKQTVLTEGKNTAREEIKLPHQDSILSIVIEDMDGKKTNYQKQFQLTGVDITEPQIQINAENGNKKMEIIAKDENEIAELSYQWENEESVTKEAENAGEKEIKQEIELKPGSKSINIIAKDTNGNIKEMKKEFKISTSKPKLQIFQNADKLYLEASDEDGIDDIIVNINGKVLKAENINLKNVRIDIEEKLKNGNNLIAVEISNINGHKETASAEIKYEQ